MLISVRCLGIRHFYDAFSLHAEASIRAAAIAAFQFQPSDVSSDLVISSEAAVATIVLGGSYNPAYTLGYNLGYNQDRITFPLSYLP